MKFEERVLEVVKRIKKGEVMSYSEVADRAGNPLAARAVGNAMKKNWDPEIPCWRVVGKNGIGGWNRGVAEKRRILESEGVDVERMFGRG